MQSQAHLLKTVLRTRRQHGTVLGMIRGMIATSLTFCATFYRKFNNQELKMLSGEKRNHPTDRDVAEPCVDCLPHSQPITRR